VAAVRVLCELFLSLPDFEAPQGFDLANARHFLRRSWDQPIIVPDPVWHVIPALGVRHIYLARGGIRLLECFERLHLTRPQPGLPLDHMDGPYILATG